MNILLPTTRIHKHIHVDIDMVIPDNITNAKMVSCGSPKNIERTCSGTLPNKYAKLMHFGFWILANIEISNDIRNDGFDKLKLFSDVSSQIDLYDTFCFDEKEIAKTMRKFVTEKNREQRKAQLIKETIPIGRDQHLRNAFIDNIIANFNCGRTNNFELPV